MNVVEATNSNNQNVQRNFNKLYEPHAWIPDMHFSKFVKSSFTTNNTKHVRTSMKHNWNPGLCLHPLKHIHTQLKTPIFVAWERHLCEPKCDTSINPSKWNCRFIITIGIRSAAIANIQENGNCLQICRAHKWHHQIYINICNSIILLVFYVASPSQPHNSWDGFSIEIRHSMTLFMGKYGSHMTNKNHMEFPVVSSRKIGRFSRYQRPRMSPPVPSAVPRSAPHLAVTTWNDMKRPLKTSYPAW